MTASAGSAAYGRASLNISFRQVPTFNVPTPPDSPSPREAEPEPNEQLDHCAELPLKEQYGADGGAAAATAAPTMESIVGISDDDWEREFAAMQALSPGRSGGEQHLVQQHLGTGAAIVAVEPDLGATNSASILDPEPMPTETFAPPEDGLEAAAQTPSYVSPVLEVSDDIAQLLQEAFEEESQPSGPSKSSSLSGFKWTGIMDAAQAAWIGGTQLLKYGELLPGGVAKAVDFLVGCSGAPDAHSCSSQLILELGAGRGRLALQLFLMGAAVIGVELASERYGLAISAMERLAHRLPEDFSITKRTSQVIRLGRRSGPRGAVCEVRLGNFLNKVADGEIAAATLVFCQVCMPPAVYPSVRSFMEKLQVGCRVLMFERMESIWGKKPCPFKSLGEVALACTWESQKGHRFFCYEKLDMPADTSAAVEATTPPEDDDWESSSDEEGSGDSTSGGWV
mmetsp:Transcript_34307/g.80232  ORF Transcript_34307/g.80232 Transcript_34307/m.80232 type:complete len:454 (+) Transcript_34307:120-1481(+)